MDGEFISAIIVYGIIGLLLFKNRKKIQVMAKVFFVYKWEKGAEYIKKLTKCTWFWKIVSTISIPVCLFLLVFGIDTLVNSAINILSTPNPSPAVSILIPGVRIPGSEIYVPFWYGIISILIIVITHEGLHGIIGITEKIKIKSVGTGLFLFLPLAFVEFDTKSLLSASRLSRIRTLCAGSFANIVTALLAIFIVVNVMYPIIDFEVNYTNVIISSTLEGLPAYEAGIPNNSPILMINNETIENITDFHNVLLDILPNENITITTNESVYSLTTSPHPDNESVAYLGVMVEQGWQFKESLQWIPEVLLNVPFFLLTLLVWVSNLSFAIGMFNMIPLWITDGGKVLVDLLSIPIKNNKLLFQVVNIIFSFVLGILLFNMFGPYFL